MMIQSMLRPLVLLSILAAAAITDAVHHKIYNTLIASGICFELILSLIYPTMIDPIALTYAVGFLSLTLFFFFCHWMGGGDVKLYMLTTLAYPNQKSVRIIVLSILLSGVYALWLLIRSPGEKKKMIPMGVFIFAGACATLLV